MRFLVVGTIGKEERPPRGQLWMEKYLIKGSNMIVCVLLAVHETVGHDQVAHKIGCLCISL